MSKDEFYRNLEELMELDTGTIKGGEELRSLGDWNSLTILSFIAFADAALGLSLNPDDLKRSKSVEDLACLIEPKISQ